jgi:hypothetical protein
MLSVIDMESGIALMCLAGIRSVLWRTRGSENGASEPSRHRTEPSRLYCTREGVSTTFGSVLQSLCTRVNIYCTLPRPMGQPGYLQCIITKHLISRRYIENIQDNA